MSSSIKSGFQFLSYKILKMEHRADRNIELIGHNNGFAPWEFNVSLSPAAFVKSKKIYACGVTLTGTCMGKNHENVDVEVVAFGAEIVGLFQAEEKFDAELEKMLIRLQAPTLLFSHLRGAIVAFMAASGFGTVIIPLINIAKIAETSPEVPLQELD